MLGRIFFPQYKKGRKGIEIIKGETILEHIRELRIEIDSECGGIGKCGKDIVRIERGLDSLSGRSAAERHFELESDERLACQAEIINSENDIIVFIKSFGKYTILTDVRETKIDLNPFVEKKGERVFSHTGEDLGRYYGKILGLAVDVGTTTLVLQVINLENSKTIGTIARKNPQIAYGNDVISRIGYTMTHSNGLKELQRVLMKGINNCLEQLENETGESIEEYIYDVVAVGNSTMRDIFIGQDVSSLGVIPFESLNRESKIFRALDVGLTINQKSMAYVPPLIGGHAGADAVANIIASRMYKSEKVMMVIDIGTNGEVAIGNKEKIMTASCAAGGAYEGATIPSGVGAIEGAITNVWEEDGTLRYKTIGDKQSVGICGSGLIDLLAILLKTGHLSKTAKLKNGEFSLTDGVNISQKDINELITAKAGLRSDQDLLMKYYGVQPNEINSIYLSGAFGNYINVDNAITIGLYPPIKSKKFIMFGNGALAGAREMLLSQEKRNDAEKLAALIEHTRPNEIEGVKFQYIVADRMYFQ